jgi:hypothetical protein
MLDDSISEKRDVEVFAYEFWIDSRFQPDGASQCTGVLSERHSTLFQSAVDDP